MSAAKKATAPEQVENVMPQAKSEDTGTRALHAIDGVFREIDHAQGLIGVLLDGLIDPATSDVGHSVPYSPMNLFRSLQAIKHILGQAYQNAEVLDSMRQLPGAVP